MTWRVEQGDCLEVMRGIPDNSIDATVVDPPYGLGTKEPDVARIMLAWASGESARVNENDFMGKDWQLPGPEYWREVYRVLKPGAHLLCFAGTRTWDLMSIAIRFAGFENRDTIAHHFSVPALSWTQGQGFPKGLDISAAIDKLAGIERSSVGVSHNVRPNSDRGNGMCHSDGYGKVWDITTPATDDAKRFSGWNVALKPSWEVILVFRKPLSESTVAKNVLKYGTGGINVDACRIPGAWSGSTTRQAEDITGGNWAGGNGKGRADLVREQSPAGRWPPNTVFSHVPPDENGEGGCHKIGVKKVKGGNGVRGSGGTVYGGGKGYTADFQELGQVVGYADPDGMETVEEYDCVEGGSIDMPSFSYKTGVLFPLDAPVFLLDRLQALLQDLAEYSNSCNSPLPREDEPCRSEGTEPSGPFDALDREYDRAFGLSGLPGFRQDYQLCRGFCDERARALIESSRVGLPSLLDVLSRVYSDLCSLAHSPRCQPLDRPSSSDACLPRNTDANSLPNNISVVSLRDCVDETRCCTPDMSHQTTCGETPNSNPWNKNDATDNREIPLDIAGTTVAVRLLCTLSFDLACLYLPVRIIHKEMMIVNTPMCPVAELDRQSGVTRVSKFKLPSETSRRRMVLNPAKGWNGNSMDPNGGIAPDCYGDIGGSSRFFPNFSWEEEEIVPFRYISKASRRERSAGLDGFPKRDAGIGDPSPSGQSYQRLDGRPPLFAENHHPTVKAVALMRWLVKLVTPADGTILDPFMGSGSTGCAAVLEGFNFIGIEREPEYLEIAKARIAYWESHAPDVKASPKSAAKEAPKPELQASLFDLDRAECA